MGDEHHIGKYLFSYNSSATDVLLIYVTHFQIMTVK